MEFNVNDIQTSLMDAAVAIENTSYEALLNMPVQTRDLMVKSYNKRQKKMNQ